jgi:malate dehydrogenase
MERKDLLLANYHIFVSQGRAINNYANKDVKVVVIGNPANTNTYIANYSAPDIHPSQFTCLTRLDHNRALFQLAKKLDVSPVSIRRICIWGNHSPTMYADINHALVDNKPVVSKVDSSWIFRDFIPAVSQRGTEIIKSRGLSSASSAANAAIEHMRYWVFGTAINDWTSMGIVSDGSYGIPQGLVFSFPVICQEDTYKIVKNLDIDATSKTYIEKTCHELKEERDSVASLI